MLVWLEAPAASSLEFIKASHLKFSRMEQSQAAVNDSKVEEHVILASENWWRCRALTLKCDQNRAPHCPLVLIRGETLDCSVVTIFFFSLSAVENIAHCEFAYLRDLLIRWSFITSHFLNNKIAWTCVSLKMRYGNVVLQRYNCTHVCVI